MVVLFNIIGVVMIYFSQKQVVLFDLDGTVIDSSEGIFNSIDYVFKELSIDVQERSILQKFIGPSLASSFRKFCGMNDEQANHAVKIYREYYKTKGILECSVYDGLENLLKLLKQQDKKIGLATKKPEPYAIEIMKTKNLLPYFDCICGSSLAETDDDKSHIILRCAQKLSNENLDSVVHIGDTYYDVIGAKHANVECIGVLYGFGTEQELLDEGADAIATDMNELTEILTSHPHTERT